MTVGQGTGPMYATKLIKEPGGGANQIIEEQEDEKNILLAV